MIAKILYINLEREWRRQTIMSSDRLDVQLCQEADIVLRYDHGLFHVIKDRYQLAGTVSFQQAKDPIDDRP